MPGSFVLFPRIFAVICAAVGLIIICLHAVRANPDVPIKQKIVKYSILRPLNTVQQVPSSAGLLSEERVQTPADPPSISNHQPYPVQFTQGSFSYSQNGLDKMRPRVKITKVESRGIRPPSSVFTTRSPYEEQSFDRYKIPNTFPQKERNSGNSYNSVFKYPKEPGNEGEVPTSYSSKVDEENSARKLHSVYPSQTGRHQSAQLLTARVHRGNFLETSQPSIVRVQSGTRRIQVGKGLEFPSQLRGVVKQNPRPEKPSISVFPHNQNSISSEEMLEHNNVKLYRFKDSPAKVVGQKVFRGQSDTPSWAKLQSPSGAQEKSRFFSKINHFTRTDQNKEESEAQIGFSRPRVILYPGSHKATTPTPGFLYPVSAEVKNWQNLVPVVHSHSQDSRNSFAPLDPANVTSREPRPEYRPRQSVKRFSRLDGHSNSERKPVKEMSGLSSADRTQSTLNERKHLGFKFSNAYPSLSQKFSFGQRRSYATATPPAKPDANSPPPVTQVWRTPTAPPFTSTLRSPQPEPVPSIHSDENTENRFRLYKGRFGLKGYGSKPLEGAKAIPRSADTPITSKLGYKGFELRNSAEVTRPERIRIHRWYDQTGKNGDFKTPPTTAVPAGSVPQFTSHQTTNKPQTLQGFPSGKNQTVHTERRITWKYPEQNIVRLSKIAASSHMTSAQHLTNSLIPTLRPRAADENKHATEEGSRFRTPTSHTVRGKRVRLTQSSGRKLIGFIIRNSTGSSIIRRPHRVKAVTYEDIVGSASFSSVRASGEHPDHFLNMTTGQEEGWGSKPEDVKDISTSPEANVTKEKKDDKSAERKDEADNEVDTSDLFFETEGSGSFDLSNILSATEDETAGNDLLELDYLQKSTGNISFESLRKSNLDH